MNDSTNPSPLLANLNVGDMVTHRWRFHLSPYGGGVYGSDLCGIVTDIRSQRQWANLDTMHTVVEVAWISGPWAKDGSTTTYEVEDMRLMDGERVLTVEAAAAEPVNKAARIAFFGHDPHEPNAVRPTTTANVRRARSSRSSFNAEACYPTHPSQAGSAERAPRETTILLPKEPTRFPDADPAMVQAQPVSTGATNAAAPATTAAPAARKRWSKVEIVAMIKEKEGAVDRGVLCLNKHAALLPEKTRSFVAFWAGWVGSGKTLSGKHLANARRTCLFNAKVLVDAANGDI